MATDTRPGRAERLEDLRTNDSDAKPSWGYRVWFTLIVVCAAYSLDTLDNIMVGIAVPPIQADLGMSTSAVQWVVSAYVLGFGGFLLLGGRMADLVGKRKIFLLGAFVFAAGTFTGGIATDGLLVIIGRFAMGAGAAFTAPAALAIIVSHFPEGPNRNKALGIYTSLGAFGYSTGVILGGLLTELGWRWTFLAPVPIAALIIIGGFAFVPKDERKPKTGSYDFGGAVTITGGMLLVVYAIVQGPEIGWGATEVLTSFGVGAALLIAFVVIEKSVAQPLLPLRLLKVKSLVGASLTAAAILGTYMSYQFIGGLYLQSYLGWSPFQMALGFLPVGLLILMLAPQMGKVIPKVGLHWLMAIGFACYLGSFALFLRIGTDSEYWTVVFPSMVLIGLGFPMAFVSANVMAVSEVKEEEHGVAAGILQTGYQVGAAVVLAFATAAMAGAHTSEDASETTVQQYHQGMYVVVGVAAVTTLLLVVSALRNSVKQKQTS
ncbi:MFS transporter [Salininema proteolyticum]|uniref:MFS transporter n=1 Tax=Salininema proteolyticum TaxID=1607685 RepID=A0ABV8TYR5_9ACTN